MRDERAELHTRFRKGKSGNPTGKRKYGETSDAQALIRQEVYRLLTVREGDAVKKMPALQAVIRSQIAAAAKGNVTAQRALVKIVQDIEDARARRTGASANKKLNKDGNDITDEELMDILETARNDKSHHAVVCYRRFPENVRKAPNWRGSVRRFVLRDGIVSIGRSFLRIFLCCVCRKLRPFDPVTESLNVRDMVALLCFLLALLASPFRSKSRLEAENAALRQQLIVLQRGGRVRVRLTNSDRLFFVQLYRWFPSALKAVTIIRPETLVRWHRAGFRRYWRWQSRALGGRPQIDAELRALIRRMSVENLLWGAPRIHGEVVPTIYFNLLYVLVIVRLARRELVWINVASYPTAEWIARQVTEAFPWDEAPRYLIRDQDGVYGAAVTRRLRAMGIRDKPIAPGSPWQNGFAERLIGSIRRECVDHVVVLSKAHLRRILQEYACYYNELRTHRSLNKDAPCSRPVQQTGHIQSRSLLGGLHHQYVRI